LPWLGRNSKRSAQISNRLLSALGIRGIQLPSPTGSSSYGDVNGAVSPASSAVVERAQPCPASSRSGAVLVSRDHHGAQVVDEVEHARSLGCLPPEIID
jgi:hypothetical protein